MGLPGVDIQIQNGALPGLVPTDDGLAGLLLQGPAATSLSLLTPRLVTRLADVEALGIDADYDELNGVRVYHHLAAFYAEAGDGARIWIMLVSQAVGLTAMADLAETDYAVQLLTAAAGKIRLLGITRSPDAGYASDAEDDHVDADVLSAIGKAQALAEGFAASHEPVRVLLEGTFYDGDFGGLVDLTERTDNRVTVLLGDTTVGNGAALGLLLGRAARIPVQRNIGRVKDGALKTSTAFIGVKPVEQALGEAAVLHDKGFVTLRTYQGKAGYFFSNDPTATSSQDDYRRLSYGRVIDKATTIAYVTYVEQVLDEVAIDAQGRIDPALAKYYQAIIERAVNQAMTANGEISGFAAYIDLEQNVITTGRICIEARIRPVGYAQDIIVKLGFQAANNV
jgi:hypothetical protein